MSGLYVALGLVIVFAGIAFAAYRWGRSGAQAESASVAADAKTQAAERQIEMHREGTAIRDDLHDQMDPELREELEKWSRPPR